MKHTQWGGDHSRLTLARPLKISTNWNSAWCHARSSFQSIQSTSGAQAISKIILRVDLTMTSHTWQHPLRQWPLQSAPAKIMHERNPHGCMSEFYHAWAGIAYVTCQQLPCMHVSMSRAASRGLRSTTVHEGGHCGSTFPKGHGSSRGATGWMLDFKLQVLRAYCTSTKPATACMYAWMHAWALLQYPLKMNLCQQVRVATTLQGKGGKPTFRHSIH